MRLIHAQNFLNDLDCFAQQNDNDALPYAIVSHTWGQEELTFGDVVDVSRSKTLKHRKGHSKIQDACRQAIRDGLTYIWIDTCCISKSSSAEL